MLFRAFGLASLTALLACQEVSNDPPELNYVCGSSLSESFVHEGGTKVCGEGDPLLPPEPTLPTDDDVCVTIKATKQMPELNGVPDETELDTKAIQEALNSCMTQTKKVVRLVVDGDKAALVSGPLAVNGVTLWIDKGVTLFVSRQPEVFELNPDKPGLCGKMGVNQSAACKEFITVTGFDNSDPRVLGEGTIDGQGDQPLIGRNYSWWQLSQSLRETNGSIGNPSLIVVNSNSTKTHGVVFYKLHLQNSPKFHIKVNGTPFGFTQTDDHCTRPGLGFIAWGITILTPSRWFNSIGEHITPFDARNTDGIDPGSGGTSVCGVIACNTISTSDDQIAIKGGNMVKKLIIAHNHFGTGHGMSIGSETYTGIEDVDIYDITIDNSTRAEGEGSSLYDSNGIRIKSDLSRGGKVKNVRYHDICMRDQANAIMFVPSYNPLFSGTNIPEFSDVTMTNIRHVSCMHPIQPVVTFYGFNQAYPMQNITLNNVVIDNVGPQSVSSRYASFKLEGGQTNIPLEGPGVSVSELSKEKVAPKPCVFPVLPTQPVPAGWFR